MIPVFLFLTGIVFGSFANVVALRLGTGESLIFGGSRCFTCRARLRWFELLPVVSYIALRGRCRSCGAGISLQYPLVELASGFLFFTLYLTLTKVEPWLWITFTLTALFFWLLLVLSVYDIRHQILPDVLVAAAAGAAIASILFETRGHPQTAAAHALSGAALFAFFWCLWFFSRGRWMGLGDAKLAFAIGVFLGPAASAVAFILAFWIGAIIGVAWAFWARVKTFRIPIPFGPFLATGALISYLLGDFLIEAYLRFVVF